MHAKQSMCVHWLAKWLQFNLKGISLNLTYILESRIPYGRKFGGKIFWREDILADCWKYAIWRNLLWRLSQFLPIMIFIAKWLIECAGNLTWPWASFRWVRTKSIIKCYWKLNKSLLHLLWTVFVPSVFTVTLYTSFGSPSSRWQTSHLSFGVQNSLEKRCPCTQL